MGNRPRCLLLHLSPSSQGEFFSLANRFAVPFAPLPLNLPPDHDRMVYFGASSYFFNTAGFAYHSAGALVFEISDSMVSSSWDGADPAPLGSRFCLQGSSVAACGLRAFLRLPQQAARA